MNATLTNDEACREATNTLVRIRELATTLPREQGEALHRVARAVFNAYWDDATNVWGLRTLPDFQALELIAKAMKAPEPQAAPPPEAPQWVGALGLDALTSQRILWAVVRGTCGLGAYELPHSRLFESVGGSLHVERLAGCDDLLIRAKHIHDAEPLA